MRNQEELAEALENCIIWTHGIGYDGFDTAKAFEYLTPIYEEISRLKNKNLRVTRKNLRINF